MIRRPPRSTQSRSSAASDVYKRQSEHHVDDVLRPVPLRRGDEALHALDVPAAVGLLERPGAAGADVGAGVWLGEDHRRAPPPVDHQLSQLLLLWRAQPVDDGAEPGAGHVHDCLLYTSDAADDL